MANSLAYSDTATITAIKSFIVQAPGVNPIQIFTAVIFEFSLYDRVFLLGKLFPPSLIFVGRPRAYPSVEYLNTLA